MNSRERIRSVLREFAEELKPLGCNRFHYKSIDFKLCKILSETKYRRMFVPILINVLKSKRRKWSEIIPEVEQQKIFNVLDRLKQLDPNRKWQFPDLTGQRKFLFGTIDQFINTTLSEMSFIYHLNNEGRMEWSQVNKLDTNYTDSVNFIMDIIKMSKTFSVERMYESLIKGDDSQLVSILDKISSYPDIIYDRLLTDPEPYTINSRYYSKQGEDVEQFIEELMEKDGWTLVHRGGDGDPIDVLLGIDLIMEKNGQLKTIQCKKVWDITYMPSTMMNPDGGAFRIAGKPYVSKQRNLDYVAYGTLNGEGIVAERQQEVLKQDKDFVYTDKKVLPTPVGQSSYFYIDMDAVISKSNNINEKG